MLFSSRGEYFEGFFFFNVYAWIGCFSECVLVDATAAEQHIEG